MERLGEFKGGRVLGGEDGEFWREEWRANHVKMLGGHLCLEF